MSSEDELKHKPALVGEVDTALPQVLILGDSISMGYTPVVAVQLAGHANVYRPSTNCGSSQVYREHIQEWLGGRRWDLIHFNCGLHDTNRKNNAAFNREGERRVTLEEYAQNLSVLVGTIKNAASVVLWASSTPVPVEAEGRVPADMLLYNQVAQKIMDEAGVETNDLYSFIFPYTPECHPALNNVHYTNEGYKLLGVQVANEIRNHLKTTGGNEFT